ncbi:MAG: diaminobutyrate--2-oxoglutarate transaminase [Methylococcaceae bacterium]|nr:diaminobutyrate--2-oxoglutarate transaminase [Methylococcaceae bacterium]
MDANHQRSAGMLSRQEARESNARTYPRRLPLAIASADGIFVRDVDGREYIDCLAGAGALALGHHHPAITEALHDTLAAKVPLQTLDLMTPVKEAFVDALFASFPETFANDAKIQFCGPGGADAIEAAIKLAKTATGRGAILCFHGAYHGMTHGALSLTGELGPKQAIQGLMPDVHFLPYPYSYRCPFGVGGEEGQRLIGRYIEHILDDPNSGIRAPAAMILEVVQGEGGVIPAPESWLRTMRRITRERGIPLIIDEIQTGLGRTGSLYAFEQAGILPDILVLSKAIGGGLPLSVVVYRSALDQWQPGAHAGTFRGNQLALAAGAATIRIVREQSLAQHAERMGDRLRNGLAALYALSELVGEIRGRGLMTGIEIVDRSRPAGAFGHPAASPNLARRIQHEALQRGLILELGGRFGSVVRLLPPLITSAEQIDAIVERCIQAVLAAGESDSSAGSG